MKTSPNRFFCADCHGHVSYAEALKAPHPFVPGETMLGCPHCKAAQTLELVCDEPACWLPQCCGFQTPDGYRSTCHLHSDFPIHPSATENGSLESARQKVMVDLKNSPPPPAFAGPVVNFNGPMTKELEQALKERDAYFSEAARVKETLADIIPALELASGLKADDFRKLTIGIELTPDETAAFWLARAILEKAK